MSGIQFDNDQQQFASRGAQGQGQSSGMAAWLMRKGIIKNESQASGVLIGVIVVDLALALIILFTFVF